MKPELHGGWICYLFDRRVKRFGLWIQGEIDREAAKEKGKPQRRLKELLADPTIQPGKKKSGSLAELLSVAGRSASVKVVP
jgi:hypothetical protein